MTPEAEEKKEEAAEEEVKQKGPGAVSAIIQNIKGVLGKIKGIIFPNKSKVKEKVEEKGEREGEGKKPQSLEEIEGLSEDIIKKLKESGYRDIDELKEATVEDLIMIEGIDEEMAKRILGSI